MEENRIDPIVTYTSYDTVAVGGTATTKISLDNFATNVEIYQITATAYGITTTTNDRLHDKTDVVLVRMDRESGLSKVNKAYLPIEDFNSVYQPSPDAKPIMTMTKGQHFDLEFKHLTNTSSYTSIGVHFTIALREVA